MCLDCSSYKMYNFEDIKYLFKDNIEIPCSCKLFYLDQIEKGTINMGCTGRGLYKLPLKNDELNKKFEIILPCKIKLFNK